MLYVSPLQSSLGNELEMFVSWVGLIPLVERVSVLYEALNVE
jgi:hypothetical protein